MSGGRLDDVRLVAFDLDGVLTDGRIYISDEGAESKAFHTQDGYGMRRLLKAGIAVAVISGRSSGAVTKRMSELGVLHVIQGCEDKVAALDQIIAALDISNVQCVYVGDDIPDLPLLKHVGFAVAVANAVPALHAQCDYSTSATGGGGAVREVCELVLDARSQNGQ